MGNLSSHLNIKNAETIVILMLLDHNSHQPHSLNILAMADGSWSPSNLWRGTFSHPASAHAWWEWVCGWVYIFKNNTALQFVMNL